MTQAPALHHLMLQQLLPVLDGREEMRVQAELRAGAYLELLRAAQAGELSLSQLVITDDGCEIMPPEEDDIGSDRPKARKSSK